MSTRLKLNDYVFVSPHAHRWVGANFRTRTLVPLFEQAVKAHTKLIVNIDECDDYTTAFLEEVFGGLAREYTPEKVGAHLEIETRQGHILIREDILFYIRDCYR